MASVQILNSTLKNAQYAFRKAGLRWDRGYIVKGLQEAFNNNPQICTKKGKFTKDGIFALKRMIEDNGLNQVSNWDDMAQIVKTRQEAVRPVKQLAQKVFGEVPSKGLGYQGKALDFLEEYKVEVLKYLGGTEKYVKQMVNKELAKTGKVVDVTDYIKMLKEQTPGTVGYEKTHLTIITALDELIKSGKEVKLPNKDLLSGLDDAMLSRFSRKIEITG